MLRFSQIAFSVLLFPFVFQTATAEEPKILGEQPLWKVPAPKATFQRAGEGTIQLASIENDKLSFYSWILPTELTRGLQSVDYSTSTTKEIWTTTSEISLGIPFTTSVQTTNSLYFWDSASKNLNWVDWENPENGFQQTPLQFDSLDDVEDHGDLILALGTFDAEVSLIIGKKSELIRGGKWIIPGPIPDGRRHAEIVMLSDSLLALVGGEIPGKEGLTMFPRNQVLSSFSDKPGLSLFKNHELPIQASVKNQIFVCNDVVGVLDAAPNVPELTRLQHCLSKENGTLGLWFSGHYAVPFSDEMRAFADESLHQLYILTPKPTIQSSILMAFPLPNSQIIAKANAEAKKEELNKIVYAYYQTALKRALDEQKPILVVVPDENDPATKDFELTYRSHHVKTMLFDVIIAHPRETELEDFKRKIPAGTEIPSFVLLRPDGEFIASATSLKTSEEVFNLLKPLWAAKE